MKKKNVNIDDYWKEIIEGYRLSEKQTEQFKTYLSLIQDWNEKINLTAITDTPGIIKYHFIDSLMISNFVDFDQNKSICDIGTGAGFPGIPIKILRPDIKLILIEVNNKKIRFLQKVIANLQLENVEVCPLDWRTFLRQTAHDIDLFFARASLQPEELIRVFSPISPYKNATLVYWASRGWEASNKVIPFIEKQELYKIHNKKRKLVFLRSA